jgi:hypothetical protein
MSYNKIYDFCKVKNAGLCYENGTEPTPRVNFITDLCDEMGIEYEIDKFKLNEEGEDEIYLFNIMLLGDSDKFVVAHHDIVNPDSDNANDNSCSVINAIMIKKLRPEVNVFLVDGEEIGGAGSERMVNRIKKGDFNCRWALNLELTGRGGNNFFVGENGSDIQKWIAERFDCPLVRVPFNDSVSLYRGGIDSCVINPLPITSEPSPVQNKNGYLDFKMLFNCHSIKDSVDKIDPNDMKQFVEDICLKIIDEY